MRLVGGDGPSQGNVFIGGEPICDDNWQEADGAVVCRQLGFAGLSQITKQSAFGPVPAEFAMDDVGCTGSEERLQDCEHVAFDNCGTGEGAGVICAGNYYFMPHSRTKWVILNHSRES